MIGRIVLVLVMILFSLMILANIGKDLPECQPEEEDK